MNKGKLLLRFIPLAIVLVAIFTLTVQNKTDTTTLSNAFRGMLINLCKLVDVDVDEAWWNSPFYIRVLGHVIEYFVLGLCVGFTIRNKWKATGICIVVSILDQCIKIFVPGRYFDREDIPFDIIGFVSGLLITWVLLFTVEIIKDNELKQIRK